MKLPQIGDRVGSGAIRGTGLTVADLKQACEYFGVSGVSIEEVLDKKTLSTLQEHDPRLRSSDR